jgi:hypothetical protein
VGKPKVLSVREDKDHIAFLQKGVRDDLLCSDCETHLNRHLELKFRFILERGIWETATPYHMPDRREIRIANGVDYKSTKLFFLSILWRMSQIRDERYFTKIDLGPHAEILRIAILELEPMDERMYPIRMFRVKLDNQDAPMISGINYVRDGAFRCYRFLIPDYLIMIDVGSQDAMRSAPNSLNLKRNGTIGISLADYREIAGFSDIKQKILDLDSQKR